MLPAGDTQRYLSVSSFWHGALRYQIHRTRASGAHFASLACRQKGKTRNQPEDFSETPVCLTRPSDNKWETNAMGAGCWMVSTDTRTGAVLASLNDAGSRFASGVALFASPPKTPHPFPNPLRRHSPINPSLREHVSISSVVSRSSGFQILFTWSETMHVR